MINQQRIWVDQANWRRHWDEVQRLQGGGQGNAWRVRRKRDGREGFLKAMKAKKDSERRARFSREANAYGTINAKGIPRLIESNAHLHLEKEVEPYIVTDFIEGVWCNKAAEARLVAGRSAAHGPCREPHPSPVSGGRRAAPLSHRQMRILSIGLVGWPRTDVWSAASGGAETSSQFRDGRRRAPFRPPSATIPGERARFRPLAPPVAVWAALCGGVAGVWLRRRDRAPWADCGCGGERVSSARGCASCPNVSPDGPTGPPLLRGGASHEAEGRPATRRRLCVLRQIGDQLVPGLEQFLLVDDVVAVEDGAALVAGQAHGNPLGDAGPAPPARPSTPWLARQRRRAPPPLGRPAVPSRHHRAARCIGRRINGCKRPFSTRLAPVSRAHTVGRGLRASAAHTDPASRQS